MQKHDDMPDLGTQPIQLTEINRTDLPQLQKWINDADIARMSSVYRPISDIAQEQWFTSIATDASSYIFGIRLMDDSLIGICQLTTVNTTARSAELRIRIGEKEHWGKGYGYQATMKLLDFAFNTLNLHRVWLTVFSFNKQAIRLYQKAGFTEEGVMRQAFYGNGEYHDILLMSMLKNEYRA